MFLFILSVYNIMKGGSKIKKVILKFIGTGINVFYQADVCIYDKCGNLVYEGKTYNRKLIICLKKNEVYRLVAKSYGEAIINAFYVNEKDEEYVFFFKRGIFKSNNLRTITFLLTDANYGNLQIEKGEMILWQKQ